MEREKNIGKCQLLKNVMHPSPQTFLYLDATTCIYACYLGIYRLEVERRNFV